MRRHIITSIFLALICGQMAWGQQTVEYGNTIDDNVRTNSRLVYDRKFPEQGFVITTKEKKSQQE